ncbi:regulator of chromosome condensation 1/beta-lactamase-inhibitor protein II [Rhypophila decipiens]|uniref:Regulator of chromosome condensation 1/beta-lactamase-inhibitor protein II n=1 Tax=Rhypophila decipiens TaxID=261697 RepID=A0AAN7B8M5_9PEZI|nr:regulator of chromosome condensation 1/beta-lactamase-inhibitor protein II [Rhypophila decipiens]
MELFVAGFNAWNQLHFDDGQEAVPEPADIRTFTSVLTDQSIDKIEAFLSYTKVHSTPSGLRSAGLAPKGHEVLGEYLDEPEYLTAWASNGVIVVYTKATRSVQQYNSIKTFCTHHEGSRYSLEPAQQPVSSCISSRWSFTFPDPIIQLIAYETGFVALSSKGTVYTWGDERYSACLGRQVTDDSPADQPSPITHLESPPTGKITKVATGCGTGTILAALTKGNDLYAWGQSPRTEPCRRSPSISSCSISISPSSSSLSSPAATAARTETKPNTSSRREGAVLSSLNLTADPTPVDVADWKDIADFAIGERHLLALTTEGELFVVGDNSNGQLGLPDVEQSTDVWTKVEIDDDRIKSREAVITGVVAGPRNSFVMIRTN